MRHAIPSLRGLFRALRPVSCAGPGKALAACCCLVGLTLSGTLLAAEVHLRGHWVQAIDDEERFVVVLSRAEDGTAASVELHLDAYRDGVFLGEEVHRIALPETVKLFSFPFEDGADCYQVEAVIGLDAEGGEVSAEDDSPEQPDECGVPDLMPTGAARPA